MSEPYTRVEIAFYPEHLNWWLRFGAPQALHDLDRRRSLALFKPGQVFGYVRWQANDYGTRDWRFTIVRSAGPSLPLSRIQGVDPGGDVLLIAAGKTKVKRALLRIDGLESAGFEPAAVSPAYYRHVHNRIATARPVRAYGHDQHRAHLAARKLAS